MDPRRRLGCGLEGCVIRDHNGKWLVGEGRNIDPVGDLTAEILAILYGLKLAWRKWYRSVVLKSDSAEAVNMIIGRGRANVQDKRLIQDCKDLIAQSWSVRVEHISREDNQAADWVAKWAADQGVSVFKLIWSPPDFTILLEEDEHGSDALAAVEEEVLPVTT